MKKFPFILTATVLALGIPVLSSHGDDKEVLKALMTKKLESAQKVLEGLSLNDYELVAKNGNQLIEVSKAIEWRALQTPQYEMHGLEFRRAAEKLVEQAKAKNTDGIAQAYVDMTMTCVRCHKHVRDTRMARLDRDR